jgi:chromosome segregation ATPase
MEIKELNSHLSDIKSKIEDKEVLKKLELIIEGGKSVEKTFTDQFDELKTVKESVKSIKETFQLDENTPFKEIGAKVKEKYDGVVQEKDSLGQSADDQTKSLATLKTEIESLTTNFNKSQEEIRVGKEQLADKELSENIRNAYKGALTLR